MSVWLSVTLRKFLGKRPRYCVHAVLRLWKRPRTYESDSYSLPIPVRSRWSRFLGYCHMPHWCLRSGIPAHNSVQIAMLDNLKPKSGLTLRLIKYYSSTHNYHSGKRRPCMTWRFVIIMTRSGGKTSWPNQRIILQREHRLKIDNFHVS